MEKQLYAIMATKLGRGKKFLVATFDDRKDALEYIRRSKLSKRSRARINPGQIYRPDSLLRKCGDAWVEGYINSTPAQSAY